MGRVNGGMIRRGAGRRYRSRALYWLRAAGEPAKQGRSPQLSWRGGAVLAFALAASAPALAQEDEQESLWYLVEVLIFADPDPSAARQEEWEPQPELAYPEQWHRLAVPPELFGEYEGALGDGDGGGYRGDSGGGYRGDGNPPRHSRDSFLQSQGNPDASGYGGYGGGGYGGDNGFGGADGYGGDGAYGNYGFYRGHGGTAGRFRFDGDDGEDEDGEDGLGGAGDSSERSGVGDSDEAAEADGLSAAEDPADLTDADGSALPLLPDPPVPFQLLAGTPDFLALEERFIDAGLSVLYQGSWIQPRWGESLPLLISGGQLRGIWPELQGSLKLRFENKLYRIDAALWLNTDGGYLPRNWQMPPPPPPPDYVLENRAAGNWPGGEASSAQPWGGGAQPPPSGTQPQPNGTSPWPGGAQSWPGGAQPPSTGASSWGNAPETGDYLWRHAVTLNRNIRMRDGEWHYIDHPMLGMVIRATSYEPPEPEPEPEIPYPDADAELNPANEPSPPAEFPPLN